MIPILLIQLTGRGIALTALTVVAVLGVLALVWFLTGPGVALAAGLGLVLLVRGVLALLTPPQ